MKKTYILKNKWTVPKM